MQQETDVPLGISRDKWNIKIQKKDLMHHILQTHFESQIQNDESFIITTHLENQEDEQGLVGH